MFWANTGVRQGFAGTGLAASQDPGQNKVSNNEGAAALRQQGVRRENTLLYSTDEQRRWRGRDCSRQSSGISTVHGGRCSGARMDSLF
jgi:hypothetical protein